MIINERSVIRFVFENSCSECHVEARVQACVLFPKGKNSSLCVSVLDFAGYSRNAALIPSGFIESDIKATSSVFAYIPGALGM